MLRQWGHARVASSPEHKQSRAMWPLFEQFVHIDAMVVGIVCGLAAVGEVGSPGRIEELYCRFEGDQSGW